MLPHVTHHIVCDGADFGLTQITRTNFCHSTHKVLLCLKSSNAPCANQCVTLSNHQLHIVWNYVSTMHHNQILHAAHKVKLILPNETKVSCPKVLLAVFVLVLVLILDLCTEGVSGILLFVPVPARL